MVHFCIYNDGNVGIRTQSPASQNGGDKTLEIYGEIPSIVFNDSQGGENDMEIDVDNGVMTFYELTIARMTLNNGNLGIGTTTPSTYKLYVDGAIYCSSGVWDGSDIRWKKNITPLKDSLKKVTLIKGVNFNWKTEEYADKGFNNKKQIDFIAQDVEKVIPELVKTDEDGYKTVSYAKMTAVLVEVVKELKA